MSDEYEVTTPDGSDILVEYNADLSLPLWVGCPGRFGADELRDMADALDAFDPDDHDDEEEEDDDFSDEVYTCDSCGHKVTGDNLPDDPELCPKCAIGFLTPEDEEE